MKKSTGLLRPFFAGFLENQAQQSIQGGGDPSTTNVIPDQAQTQKYPSDQEDNPTDKEKDDDYSKKFPSDWEDA
ncbi:microviridin/marinostatin family tricyclic proteinase inhibitor [Taibaiella koreensis]|uniref:microviridin/marinostatin family tricyclic proteinase inhibitor n=1 Tax=Taibaiella koreensis TaxID=1268548 RepID=UPI000E59AA3C|nr:microviridin/marinostatin family tricyclic proteinase inhibitor [Taibaiella koreensis]